MCRVIILAIGNELILGETLDTNTHWLCRYLTGLGAKILRTAMLPDQIDTIGSELLNALNSQPQLIITIGGLGPTDDDITLSTIAHTLNLPLMRNDQAYQWIANKYQQFTEQGFVDSATMNPAREKMALLPKGALPLANSVGVAPAVQINYQNSTIIALPGVPAEFRSFVTDSLAPFFQQLFGVAAFMEQDIIVACGDESMLAPILRTVSAQFPEVTFKSKPVHFAQERRFVIKLRAQGTRTEITASINAALEGLKAELAQAGISLLPTNN